ncbi:MAG: hypothetical protein KGI40_09835 [Xanthomonadaceae bacterium]|nr:hypothetical protein [Xanthomonadaceae bacterium]MDE2179009.1 hypothetical protein [Xanthomonadaceae bacterium]
MGTPAFGAMMGLGFGFILVALLVAILGGALILMLAVKLVEKSTPSFGKAIVTVLAIFGALIVVNIVLGLLFGALGLMTFGAFGIARLLILVADFLVTAWVIQKLIGVSMGYGRACLVTLVEYAIGLVIGVVFMLVGGLIFGGAMMHLMH